MSKKKSTTETETTLTIVPAITAEMGIKSEDLIAVAVARRERALTAAMHRAHRDLRDLQREGGEAQKALKAAVAAAVAEAVGERVETLKAALAALDGSVKVKVSDLRPMLSSKGEKCGTDIIEAVVTVEGARDRFTMTVSCSSTDAVREAEDAVKRNIEAAGRKMEETYALKGEIQNIASTERQARAALAEATLRGTDQGRELLEAMTQMAGLMEVPQIGMTLNDEVK
jgi:hypothetical protein